MQVVIDGNTLSVVVGSSVLIKAEIWVGPGGPQAVYAVTKVDDKANVFFIADPASADAAPLQDIQLSPDAIASVVEAQVPLVQVDLGGGLMINVAPDAAKIIQDQLQINLDLQKQIADFKSGAAIVQLQSQIDSLAAQVKFLGSQVVDVQAAGDWKAIDASVQAVIASLALVPPPVGK